MREQPATLRDLSTSWAYELEPPAYSEGTGKLYLNILGNFRDFLARDGRGDPVITEVTPNDIRRWQTHRAETGRGRAGGRISPTTLNLEHRALHSFWRWAGREGAIEVDPMANLRPPRPAERPVEVLTANDYTRLLAVTAGKDFEHRRNEAILRFLWATGCRLGETAGLLVDDLDLREKLARVVGKGNRERVVAFDNDARRALDRYLRARKSHAHSAHPKLWLGPKGALTESGVYQVVRDIGRAAEPPIPVHPHQLRHTSAHNQLAAGMPEQAVMSLHGWKSPQMLARYGASKRHERAVAAYRSRMDGQSRPRTD
jgi:integrase/recombinase XerC